MQGSAALREVVLSAKSGSELSDVVFGGTGLGAVDLFACFGDRFRRSLAKGLSDSGLNGQSANCRADFWVKELRNRAASGKPVRDLSAAPDFKLFAEVIAKQCG